MQARAFGPEGDEETPVAEPTIEEGELFVGRLAIQQDVPVRETSETVDDLEVSTREVERSLGIANFDTEAKNDAA